MQVSKEPVGTRASWLTKHAVPLGWSAVKAQQASWWWTKQAPLYKSVGAGGGIPFTVRALEFPLS